MVLRWRKKWAKAGSFVSWSRSKKKGGANQNKWRLLFQTENDFSKNVCDEKPCTCVFLFHLQPHQVLKKRDFKQNLSIHKAPCMSPLAPLALPLWELPSFQVWKTWVRPVSEGTASGFHPLKSSSHLWPHHEQDVLSCISGIQLPTSGNLNKVMFVSKEHSKPLYNFTNAKGAWRNEKITRHFSSRVPRDNPATPNRPIIFFPKYSKLWSLPNLKVIKLEKQYMPLNAWSHAWLFFFFFFSSLLVCPHLQAETKPVLFQEFIPQAQPSTCHHWRPSINISWINEWMRHIQWGEEWILLNLVWY